MGSTVINPERSEPKIPSSSWQRPGVILNPENQETGSEFHFVLDDKKTIKILDATGREVNYTTNQILFHIYDDGSVEKKFIVE